MDEYISREALLAEIAADYGNWIAYNDTDESYRQGVNDEYNDTIRLINDIPSADVQPVKHGWWMDNPSHSQLYSYICSNCRNSCDWTYRYCPNCGSKNRMDGDNE